MSNEDIKILNSQIKDLQNQKHKLQEEKKKDKYAKDKRKRLQDLLGKIVPEGFSIISDDVQEFLDAKIEITIRLDDSKIIDHQHKVKK